MKKIVSLILCLLCLILCVSCNEGGVVATRPEGNNGSSDITTTYGEEIPESAKAETVTAVPETTVPDTEAATTVVTTTATTVTTAKPQPEPVDLRALLFANNNRASGDKFIACENNSLKPIPEKVFGIISAVELDINKDGKNELVALRSADSETGSQGDIVAEIYRYDGAKLVLADSEVVCGLDSFVSENVYLFYSKPLNKYCILADTCGYGSYTRINWWSAKVFTLSGDSIEKHGEWEMVPMVGIQADFETELAKVGAPFAEYCTDYNDPQSGVYYRPMCKVVSEAYTDSTTFEVTCHLAVTDTSGLD